MVKKEIASDAAPGRRLENIILTVMGIQDAYRKGSAVIEVFISSQAIGLVHDRLVQ